MSWTDHRIVAFDTETTGLNPFDGDRVMEFGAVELTVDADYRVTAVATQMAAATWVAMLRSFTAVMRLRSNAGEVAARWRALA